MKVISLTQPWATLIALGAKKIETRSWKTDYRGPLAIHAAKTWNEELVGLVMRDGPFRLVLREAGYKLFSQLPRGAVVATCELVDCQCISGSDTLEGWHAGGMFWEFDQQECAFGDYTPGRWAWLLADVKPLPAPIPMRGAQGLFELPGELVTP